MSARDSGEGLWIVIPNWDDFQHYPDRDPIWIKNYRRLLADWNYLGLTCRQRGILHGIWLLYAASGRQLGANVAQLGRMLGDPTVRARDIKSLSDAGFITTSASKPLAPRYHSRASREEEKTREEPRTETSTQKRTNEQYELNNGSTKNGSSTRPRVTDDLQKIGKTIEHAFGQEDT